MRFSLSLRRMCLEEKRFGEHRMKQHRTPHSDGIIRLGVYLFCAILTIPVTAQEKSTHNSQWVLGYDRQHEITLSGTIFRLVTQHEPGSPIGLHILVNASQGLVDAHLGP
jgi:hypothetical protein